MWKRPELEKKQESDEAMKKHMLTMQMPRLLTDPILIDSRQRLRLKAFYL